MTFFSRIITRFFILVLLALQLSPLELTAKTKKTKKGPQYTLAVAMIFRDEAKYLKEWIEFHSIVGVDHFYLFNNNSIDNYKDVLKPYIAKGIVELIEWPFESAEGVISWNDIQCNAYLYVVVKACGKAKWIALLDSDEFLFPVQKNNLKDFLKDYEGIGGIGVNWQMYGTSHVAAIPSNQLLIEALTLKAATDWAGNIHVKSIVRPECVASITNPHYANFPLGCNQVTPNKDIFIGAFAPYIAVDKIRINHYWSRDEDFFYNKKVPRRMGWYNDYDQIIALMECLNQVEDLAIYRFVPLLRQRMGLK